MEQENKKIQATPEIIAGLQQMSHDFHIGVYAETTKTYGDQEQKYIDELLSFSYKMIQTIGIVAGFGFTALGFVKNIGYFVFGEALLIFSIVYGIISLKNIYTSILEALQKSSDSKYKVLKSKSDLFVKTILGGVKDKFIDIGEFESELAKVDKKILAEFSKENKGGKDEARFLTVLILLFVFGSLFVLISFTDIDLRYLLRNLVVF